MPESVIETAKLRKEYGRRRVVGLDGLDLAVEAGTVHGLLGPNGAGKTTTLRLLTGLARPTSGEIRIFGQLLPHSLPALTSRIGAIVEAPAFTKAFTGRRNLSLLAASKRQPDSEVDRVIELMGLREHQHERYRGYSRGLRQRMGMAAALIGSPELLLLDEPTHGLDPVGARQLTAQIRAVAGEGVTVLMASHMLADVQRTCDAVSILGNGKLLSTGLVPELVGGSEGGTVELVVADPAGAHTVLTEAGHPVTRTGDRLVVTGVTDPARISELLARHGHYLRSMSASTGLERAFFSLTESTVEPPSGESRTDAGSQE